MKKLHYVLSAAFSVFLFGFVQASNAAILNVTDLEVDSFEITATAAFGTLSYTETFSPPALWFMGIYNGTVASGTVSSTLGSIDYFVDSTGTYGGAPPSGTVDSTLGTIDLNLSDLHATLSGIVIGDFDIWDDVTSTIDTNTYSSYDPVSGTFVYGWSDVATVTYDNLPIPYSLLNGTEDEVDFSFEIAGIAHNSPVPVPPAVWLFGSGLLGLIGIARRNKAA